MIGHRTELNFELKANVSRRLYFRFARFHAAFNFRRPHYALPVKRCTCRLQWYRRQLAVSHHSHKIVVLSALVRLVSERNNNSFSSVNQPSLGLYGIQLRRCQICSECEAFDCCKLVCYRYMDKFGLVFVSRKEAQATSRPFYFNVNRPISDLIFLRRCIKFNPPIRVRLELIGL